MIDTNIYFAAPDPISAANSTITEVLCEGACTGAINAVISGGVGQGIGTNYQYQWYEGTSTVGTIIGTSFALGLQIHANHYQMTYYTLILLMIVFLIYLYPFYKKNDLKSYLQS